MTKMAIDHTYNESYLVKSGISLDFNRVDTVCSRKYNGIVLPSIILIVLASMLSHANFSDHGTLALLIVLCLDVAYILFYLLYLSYYLSLRHKLHQDKAPITVEAYAVVCLDLKHQFSDYVLALFLGSLRSRFYKYAVIYKEVGTNQPRFFLTAAVHHKKICFVPEHIGRVFIHRKKSHLYTVDDHSAYQTVSKKRKFAFFVQQRGLNVLKNDKISSNKN